MKQPIIYPLLNCLIMKIYGLLAFILLYCLAPLNGQNTTDPTTTQKDTTCNDCKETRNVHTTVYKTKRYEIRGAMVDLGISTYLNDGNFNLPQS